MALFHRQRTGEGAVVDVSLLSSAMWAMGQTVALSLVRQEGFTPPPLEVMERNPLGGQYRSKDGRWVALQCLRPGQYWASFCETVGRPELATDPRFADEVSLDRNCRPARAILTELFAERTLAEWCEMLDHFPGQWTVVQNTLEAAKDPQSVANGYVQALQSAAGIEFEEVAVPMQFDERPSPPRRAPSFNEHGEEILRHLGLDRETITDLKGRGIVAAP
jgi:crotonobetainyl-CoA:carnitine CoA-transferase CaiB-like acyl-CoA transferase